MQKVGPRSKLRFPALYLQQLAIPHVKHGLAGLEPGRVVMESTGVYGLSVYKTLEGAGVKA